MTDPAARTSLGILRPRLIAAAVLAAVVFIFVVQNTDVVAVRFLFWEFRMSRVLLILFTALAGFGGGYLVAGVVHRRKARRL